MVIMAKDAKQANLNTYIATIFSPFLKDNSIAPKLFRGINNKLSQPSQLVKIKNGFKKLTQR